MRSVRTIGVDASRFEPDKHELAELARKGTSRIEDLQEEAAGLRDRGFGSIVSYSPKVFIPLTKLCRDVCHYCTFAKTPGAVDQAYLSTEQVLALARAAEQAGCKEALFTLGDEPEARYQTARAELEKRGVSTTLELLKEMAQLVLDETSLLPHLNAGVMTTSDYHRLRPVAPSMGLMLESSSTRLCANGGPHYGSPDKWPASRLESLVAAGEERVPMTSGVLVGIGETRQERIHSLVSLRNIARRFGHLQEVIIQNFAPKPGTKMAGTPPAPEQELIWTIAMARIILGSGVSIQSPPNLNPGRAGLLIRSGINDWGGVSPVSIDHVNPEAPWPEIERLEQETAKAGKQLVERMCVYPNYARRLDQWVDPKIHRNVLYQSDAAGFARTGNWCAGAEKPPAALTSKHHVIAIGIRSDVNAVLGDPDRNVGSIEKLFAARGRDFEYVCDAADRLRQEQAGDDVTYVVNRNINYTNICKYRCMFCAFAKGRSARDLRGKPYLLDLDEISRRTNEARSRGATEVCLQGGIHPNFTGKTYIDILKCVKSAAPDIHVHAFSPLEVFQGAVTLAISVPEFLAELQSAGLGSMPGTAAEILDDEVRATLCPDKVSTDEWISVIESAHALGIRTTATIMFGHMEGIESWVRHLAVLRGIQRKNKGITEFVPLPFVHMEAPIYRKGQARRGPTWREAVLMHAVGRLALGDLIPNVQSSWVKMGTAGAAVCLRSGANDLGGVLMDETISRSAGARHGSCLSVSEIQGTAHAIGREARQRTTLYV